MSNDYIPKRDGDFNDWFKALTPYVAQKCGGSPPAWNHIPSEERTKLADAYVAWFTAYARTLTPHTPVDTLAKNEARKAAEAVARPFVRQFLQFPPVTDEDRLALKITVCKTGRSPVPLPTTAPELLPGTGTRRRIIIHYRDEATQKRGKPEGVHGVEVRWVMLDHYPADLGELSQSAFDTNPPLTLEFAEHERGRHIYMAGRWEIEREGEKGPFGNIVEAIVP